MRGNPPEPVRERLLSRRKITASGCWEYQRAISKGTGYGVLSVNGRLISAHRASFVEFRGEIPAGMCVLHRCDNRRCINPDHLFLGTKHVNTRDMINKKRYVPHKFKNGENCKKLNMGSAEAIRSYSKAGLRAREIAKIYGVSLTAVREIVQGRTYVA